MIFDIKSPARMDLSRPAHDFSPRGMDLLSAERDVLSAGGDFWVGEVVFLGGGGGFAWSVGRAKVGLLQMW